MLLKEGRYLPFWEQTARAGGLAYGDLVSWDKWFELLKKIRPQFALGPSMVDPGICSALAEQLEPLAYLVENPIIFSVSSSAAIAGVPLPFHIGLELPLSTPTEPWGFAGRTVWLFGRRVKHLWEQYCELVAVGGILGGIVLGGSWYSLACARRTFPKHPYAKILSAPSYEEAVMKTVENYIGFWGLLCGHERV